MLRRVGVAISVGLADSLNPSTVGPALYLATVRNRVWRVTQFTIGVFSVTFAGGLVLTIGPGRLLLGLVPHPQGTVRHVIELVAGVVLLIVAVALWRGRRSLARRELPGRSGSGGSALIAGAS
ncbi:MAG: GAP family protein, partial [Solirubrobacteraceae bacterium]